MKSLFLAYLLINAVQLACDNSCFLGNDLFSAPLDINNCCAYNSKKNCENFAQVTEGGFICVRCKFGYKYDNNECVPYQNEEICVNPSVITVPFYPCKVCRITKSALSVPKINAEKKTFECVAADLSKNPKLGKLLANCKASTFSQGGLFCYECEDNFAFKFATRTCERVNNKAKLKGCMMAFDSLHCLVCHSEFQLDFTKSMCVLRSAKIDVKGYMKKMEEEGRKQIEAMQRANMNGMKNQGMQQNYGNMGQGFMNNGGSFGGQGGNMDAMGANVGMGGMNSMGGQGSFMSPGYRKLKQIRNV